MPAEFTVSRPIHCRYEDPADLVWLKAAADLGIAVRRSADVYASWDGQGTLTLASDEHLDADDCLAQMLFHEICHLLVSGEEAREKPDWGLDNTSPRDLVYEYATNRLQAALAQGYGLRAFMAVTTVWRAYYDGLPRDPLAPGADAAIALAREGLQRALQAPYRDVLHSALAATADLASVLRPVAAADSLWQRTRGEHPTGLRLHADSGLQCGQCAWAVPRRFGKLGCRQTHSGCQPEDYRLHATPLASTSRFDATQQACEYFEPNLKSGDCHSCGACCHRGFDVVDVGVQERFTQRHPELVALRESGQYVVPRLQGRCVALDGQGTPEAPYLCRHYRDRPQACRDFALAGDACLVARRRCGISP